MSSQESESTDSKTSGVSIESVTLHNGQQIPLVKHGVTAVVGGNNAGKSTLLRQINNAVTQGHPTPGTPGQFRMVSSLTATKTGTVEDFSAWFRDNAVYQRPHPANPGLAEGYVRVGAGPVYPQHLPTMWAQLDSGNFGQLAPFLVNYAAAGSRAGIVFNTGRRVRPGDAPTDPLHYIEDDPVLRRTVFALFNDVFDQDLTLDKLGNQVSLRVGVPSGDIAPPGYEDSEIPYRLELDKLPLLGDQGDGMRSLLGLVLPVVTAAHSIVLIDEPEAFLHPPQAVKLGKILGELAAGSGTQVVLATHDRNILVGLLESSSPLSVVRLSRVGDETRAAQLQPEKIKEIWSDPVLRYTHVLDGLFHRAVVLTENERDCTFYAAASDAASKKDLLPFPAGELLFIPTSGKDGMPVVAAALNALNVPVVATPDIDMLDDRTKMKKIVESLGAEWIEFDAEYGFVTTPFRTPKPTVTVAQVASHIDTYLSDVLKKNPKRVWDNELRDELRALARSGESPWEPLKKHGLAGFPPAQSHRAVKLLDSLDEIGLVLVRIGDLEAFSKTFDVVARKGLGWLEAALHNHVHEGPAAEEHVLRVFAAAQAISGKSTGSTSQVASAAVDAT
ncbi:AAA family ATPase [Amycolatopsis sp. NPDC026612]|uniref:ATP-dependent nuclease n=1 Tax=Amycolatopsis sp. NPDC026612 TaxID=3155466 RepID=UPI0034028514